MLCRNDRVARARWAKLTSCGVMGCVRELQQYNGKNALTVSEQVDSLLVMSARYEDEEKGSAKPS